MPTPAEPITPAWLREQALPEPGPSKRDRGDVLVVGGARKTPGAASLAGLAALRVGAGRLTLAVAESVAPSLAATFPEAGVIGLAETGGGAVDGAAVLARVADELGSASCVVIGPGLDDADEATALLDALAPRIGDDVPVLLDAYGIGCLTHADAAADAFRGHLILTPNATEAGILLGRDLDDLPADTAELAERFEAVISCQGYVAAPDGRLWITTTGHPGLATSGSGDVLAGAIAGLLARGTDAALASCWATYLHAAAGDRLASRVGPLGFLARELVDELPVVLSELD